MLRIAAVSIFPDLLEQAFRYGVTGRARERHLWAFEAFDPRAHAAPPHRAVDDRPFGGGPGMVMLHEPLSQAIDLAQRWVGASTSSCPVIFLSPSGAPFTQKKAAALAASAGFTLVCGRYEGIDQRTIESHITEQISIGDYILSGGEFAACAVIDAVTRLIPGALGHAQSATDESFCDGLLEHPHYTRPEVLTDGRSVPETLLSGNHAKIDKFRREQALTQTFLHRPDLLQHASHLSSNDIDFLRSIGYTGALR